jgi:hypothetical protein
MRQHFATVFITCISCVPYFLLMSFHTVLLNTVCTVPFRRMPAVLYIIVSCTFLIHYIQEILWKIAYGIIN